MKLRQEDVEHIKPQLKNAANRLVQASIMPARVADFVPAKKRFFFTKKAQFVEISKAWRLGVFLISPDAELYCVGETTRAVPPGYPGHVSNERERRREYTKAAFQSGFPEGEVLFFNSPLVHLEAGAELPSSSALLLHDGVFKVRWNPDVTHETAVPFASYLEEQISLQIERSQFNPKE
ncbi:MAG TPA: hypothetical protein VLZ31_00205 [Microbacteriaceae bacterium]|nr:hypothetical protein [Microbacteriaceae bacterium]